MALTQEAFISAKIVKWARDRIGASFNSVADRVNVKPEKVESWEEGSTHPTFRQAQRLASVLSIPFGYLFLSEPPETRIDLPDLRTVDGKLQQTPSADFIEVLQNAILKQDWYKEYLQQRGNKALDFVGRFNLRTPVDRAAADIRETVGITAELRAHALTWEDFLRTLIHAIEDLGVLVFRTGIVGSNVHRKLSVTEFRGFVLTDPVAPAILINARDAKAAQIFTLAHELAHIWIGESGILNPDFKRRASEQINQIERFCNHVAAEVLIPRAEFLAGWRTTENVTRNIQRLSAEFKVSTVAVLLQALNLDQITYQQYERLFQHEASKWART